MIEDDFYATVKLKNGEEIFAKVSASEEAEKTILIISNPIQIKEFKSKAGVTGYKIESWLKTTTEDMFIIDMEDVLTISESSDIEIIMLYQSFVRQSSSKKGNEPIIDRKMGYLANVNDAKEILEKIFKNS
jgi:hypothetical protein